MASEFQEISLSPEISVTTIKPESFLVKLEDAKEIEFIFAVKSTHPSSEPQQGRDSISTCFVDGENGTNRSARAESISTLDDGDDGFRTPTSSDHKIPVVEQCPPAPKRPKPISWSRRSSTRASGVRRGFRVYISDEIVESIFSSTFGSDLHQKMKKARKDEAGDE